MNGYNTYVGARYVPKFDGDWDNTKEYEPLIIVSYQGNSYTSKTFVPKNASINDTKYWALTGNYNAQVEAYRQAVATLNDKIEDSFCIASDFEGENDTEILQNAIDYCQNNNIYNLIINRKFDITGHTINVYLPENTPNRRVLRLLGENNGEIYKGDSGYMFASPDVLSHGLVLQNLKISGKYSNDFNNRPDVFDCSHIIRIDTINNYVTFVRDMFHLVEVESGFSTMQSCKSLFDTFVFSRSIVRLENGIITDSNVIGGKIESNNNAFYLSAGTGSGISGLTIDGCVIEDDNNYALYLSVQDCTKLSVLNTYFEGNEAGHVYLHSDLQRGVSFSNCQFYNNEMTGHVFDILGNTMGIENIEFNHIYIGTPPADKYVFYIDGVIRDYYSIMLNNCSVSTTRTCNQTNYVFDIASMERELYRNLSIYQPAGRKAKKAVVRDILGYIDSDGSKLLIPVQLPFITNNTNYTVELNYVAIDGVGAITSECEVFRKGSNSFTIKDTSRTGTGYQLKKVDQLEYTITFGADS